MSICQAGCQAANAAEKGNIAEGDGPAAVRLVVSSEQACNCHPVWVKRYPFSHDKATFLL